TPDRGEAQTGSSPGGQRDQDRAEREREHLPHRSALVLPGPDRSKRAISTVGSGGASLGRPIEESPPTNREIPGSADGPWRWEPAERGGPSGGVMEPSTGSTAHSGGAR